MISEGTIDLINEAAGLITVYTITTHMFYDGEVSRPAESFTFDVLRVSDIEILNPGYISLMYITPLGGTDRIVGVPAADVFMFRDDAVCEFTRRLNMVPE